MPSVEDLISPLKKLDLTSSTPSLYSSPPRPHHKESHHEEEVEEEEDL